MDFERWIFYIAMLNNWMATDLFLNSLLQDMLLTHLHRMDIHALRNDPGKNFFDLKGCDGPDSAEAVERNYMFVLELCATMAGAPSLPVHSIFKAGPLHVF